MEGEVKMYLDPGSGSLLLQYIIAAVLGVGVFLRLFWGKISGFLKKGSHQEPEIKDDINFGDSDD